ncbi:hypothetical protein EJB05_44024 [Eragrostis curvula]|uniref:MOSC domain-containing protein n=1 Tax=Eragrostis curvula TaxID=38414 RepID=A0A5J9TGK6_9POAL|nr:hypothetical protein EJB05_44024 [Eragrostis curvula]
MEKVASFLSSLLAGGDGAGSTEPAATVKSIFVYPIKSCRGISVPQAPITDTGFRWDRQWMLVNSKGRALTQRVEPRLALVQVEMPPEAFAEDWEPTPEDHMEPLHAAVIKAPGMDPLRIPLVADRTTVYDVSVWEWSGSAYDEGVEVAEWFTTFFGNPTRLVRFKEASQGSLDALNEILKEPIPINCFRPNIFVDGCRPYSEDLWKTIKINKLTFLGVKLCGRCKVPIIDQDNGIPHPTEPTETLQTFRSGEVLRLSPKNKRQVYFGQNLICKESLSANGNGRIIKTPLSQLFATPTDYIVAATTSVTVTAKDNLNSFVRIFHCQYIKTYSFAILSFHCLCSLQIDSCCSLTPSTHPSTAIPMEKAASFLSSVLGGGGLPEPAATVKSILIYPIKSCRGIAVPQAPITATGFRWDRQWLVVNSKGRAYTQRVEPKMALVEVEMPPEAFTEDWQPTADAHLVIRAPGMDPLKIPLAAERSTIDDVSVWEWSGSAYDEGAEASEWFSSYFGKPSRLVRFKEASEVRPTDPNYAQGYKIMFSDCFPFLIASQGSLDALNEILKEPVPMNRFRPNLFFRQHFSGWMPPILRGSVENRKINNLTFQGVKLCNRCKVPTINQDNGIPGTEPTETLLYISVYFGQNLVCKESLSAKGKGKIIKVGDPIYVLHSFPSSNEAPA